MRSRKKRKGREKETDERALSVGDDSVEDIERFLGLVIWEHEISTRELERRGEKKREGTVLGCEGFDQGNGSDHSDAFVHGREVLDLLSDDNHQLVARCLVAIGTVSLLQNANPKTISVGKKGGRKWKDER